MHRGGKVNGETKKSFSIVKIALYIPRDVGQLLKNVNFLYLVYYIVPLFNYLVDQKFASTDVMTCIHLFWRIRIQLVVIQNFNTYIIHALSHCINFNVFYNFSHIWLNISAFHQTCSHNKRNLLSCRDSLFEIEWLRFTLIKFCTQIKSKMTSRRRLIYCTFILILCRRLLKFSWIKYSIFMI